jgi:hypothetical protein
MKEVLRTNDAVKLSYVMRLLEDANCQPFTADQYTSIVEGSIGAIPRRVLVPDEFYELALKVVEDVD